MLRSERETSDGVGMCLQIGGTIYQRMSYFVLGVNMFLGWGLNNHAKRIVGYK